MSFLLCTLVVPGQMSTEVCSGTEAGDTLRVSPLPPGAHHAGWGEQNGWLGVARPSLGLCHCPHPLGLAEGSFLSPNGDLLGDAQHWCLRKGETARARLKRLCVKRAESVAGNKSHSKQVGGGGPQRAHRTPPCAQGPVGSITQSASRCILAIGSYVCEPSVGHRVAVWSPPHSRSLVLFQRPPWELCALEGLCSGK